MSRQDKSCRTVGAARCVLFPSSGLSDILGRCSLRVAQCSSKSAGLSRVVSRVGWGSSRANHRILTSQLLDAKRDPKSRRETTQQQQPTRKGRESGTSSIDISEEPPREERRGHPFLAAVAVERRAPASFGSQDSSDGNSSSALRRSSSLTPLAGDCCFSILTRLRRSSLSVAVRG
jgi:hypothetical protein